MDKLNTSQFFKADYWNPHALYIDGFYLGLQIFIKQNKTKKNSFWGYDVSGKHELYKAPN